jgi:DNA invertase Pin-like site-specific DNA recombinase
VQSPSENNIGYARVSTDDQNLDLQRDALTAAGCERTFEDMASGAKADRIGLAALMSVLRAGDTVVIWRLEKRRVLSRIPLRLRRGCGIGAALSVQCDGGQGRG